MMPEMLILENKPVCHRNALCNDIQGFNEIKMPKQLTDAVDFLDMENPVSPNDIADEQIVSPFHDSTEHDGIDNGSFVYTDMNVTECELSEDIHNSGEAYCRDIKDICVDEGSHLQNKIVMETDICVEDYFACPDSFASKDEERRTSLCLDFLSVTLDVDGSIEDLLIPRMAVLNDSHASFVKGYDEVDMDNCNGSLLGGRDSFSSDNQMISDSCSLKSNAKLADAHVDSVGIKQCTFEYYHEKILVETDKREEDYSVSSDCFDTKNEDSLASLSSNNLSTVDDDVINDLVIPQIPILNDSESSYEKGYDTHVIDEVDMDKCNANLLDDRDCPCSDSQTINDLCVENSNVTHADVIDDVCRTSSSDYLFCDEILDRNDIISDDSIKGCDINQVQKLEDMHDFCYRSEQKQFVETPKDTNWSSMSRSNLEEKKLVDPLASSSNVSDESSITVKKNLADIKLQSGVITFTFETKEAGKSIRVESIENSNRQQFGRVPKVLPTEETYVESSTVSPRSSFVRQIQNDPEEKKSTSYSSESDESRTSSRLENMENANCLQFGQPLKIHPTEDEIYVESSIISTRNSFVHQIQNDPSCYGPASLSAQLAFSGHIPYSGSISLRSDGSSSTRSFAFPILQSEWSSSPVKMVKADRRHLRKHKSWRMMRMMLACCRFRDG